jgi:urate oxidase
MSQEHDTIRMGFTRYGKAEVRLVKVRREGAIHHLHDLTVAIALEGDFAAAYTDGDNSQLLATDTMRNTVYAFAKDHPLDSIEAFGASLARHFAATGPTVRVAEVQLTEYLWNRIKADGERHPHAFMRAAGKRTALVRAAANDVTISAGIADLLVLKTTASGWEHFYRDEYTTLADTDDRIFATSISATWRYANQADLDYSALWFGVRDRILAAFTDHYSPSVQNTLYRMGRAVLERFPMVEQIRFALPNKHHLLFNLAPFGQSNANEIFHVTSEPYGLIEGVVERGDLG